MTKHLTSDSAEVLANYDARNELATKYYESLEKRGRVNAHVVMTYRCEHRCALARVIGTKQGFIVHVSRYKTSPKITETATSESGRRANTEDGNRRWKGHTFFLDDAFSIPVSCDHLRNHVLEIAEIKDDIRQGKQDTLIHP